MSYSSQDPTSGYSATTSSTQANPIWLPGQESFTSGFANTLQGYLNNPSSTPIAATAQQVASDSAEKSTAENMSKISSTPGISSPSKAAALASLAGSGAQAGAAAEASATTSTWPQVLQALSGYAFTPAQIGYTSQSNAGSTQSGGGGQSEGLCSSCQIFLTADALTPWVRMFRDAHFAPGGRVDGGYRWLMRWLVPWMKASPTCMKGVKAVITTPLGRVVHWVVREDPRGWMFIPLAYLWVGVWGIVGSISPDHTQATPRPSPSPSKLSSMTATFLYRALGGR